MYVIVALGSREPTPWLREGAIAGAVAAVISGAPSTLHGLLVTGDPLQASRAAGSLLVPSEQRAGRLLVAAVPVHLAVSLGWAIALAGLMQKRATALRGALAGLAIAALDLGLIGRRFHRIRELPTVPQVADHVLFGAVVGGMLGRRLSGRRPRLQRL